MQLFSFFKTGYVALDPNWELLSYLVETPVDHRFDVKAAKLKLPELQLNILCRNCILWPILAHPINLIKRFWVRLTSADTAVWVLRPAYQCWQDHIYQQLIEDLARSLLLSIDLNYQLGKAYTADCSRFELQS